MLPELAIQNKVLPNVNSVRDLGINVTNYLSPSDHVSLCDITTKAHKRASLIRRCFVSHDTDLLVRAFKVMSGRYTHTHTHTFNGPFSGTTQVSQYQKGKTQSGFY